jgi:hypothetical protein
MTNPDAIEPYEPDWEEIEEGLVAAQDLLAAATLVELVDPADVVADLYGLVRHLLEVQRNTAMVLRKVPSMAEKMADHLDTIADISEQMLPAVEDGREL